MSATQGYGQDFGPAFQSHILAVMARIPGLCVRFRTALDARFFVSEVERAIADALLDHVDEHTQLPQPATLIEAVRPLVGKADFEVYEAAILKLYKRDISDSGAVIARIVDFGKQQALANAILESANRLDKGDRNIRPLIDTALLVGEDLLSLGIEYGDLGSRMSWYTDPQTSADVIRTGIPHVDEVMGGGLERGTLGVVLAPPKRGKTTTLINIGFGALADVRGLCVAHYSLEMKDKKVAQRYDDRLMGSRVKFKRADPVRYVKELEARAAKFLRGTLFVKSYPTRSATPSSIRAHLSLLASRGFKPSVIIIDYADIMLAERRLGEMRHEQAGIYEDLRALAGEFDAVVWTGSQAKRGALEKEVITIDDFAESFEKAAVVDAAWAFCVQRDQGVVTRDGTQKMLDVRRRVLAGERVEVLSHNFRTGEDEWRSVVKSFHNGTAPVMGFLRVRTEITGRSKGAVTTPEHSYFDSEGEKVEAKELRVGDLILGRAHQLSFDQLQVVFGTVLGDASIRPDGTLAIEHGPDQFDFLTWKEGAFSELPSSVTEIQRDAGDVGGCALKARMSRMLTIRGSLDVRRLYKTFYPNGVKVVPQAVLDQLGPLGLAVWVMDDGSFAKGRDRLTLYTNGFDEASRDRICRWFRERWECVCSPLGSGALQFDALSTRRIQTLTKQWLTPCSEIGRTKRFHGGLISPGRVVSRPVAVLSVDPATYRNRDRLDMEVDHNHNYYLASGVLVSNCQTDDERIDGRARLFAAALRDAEDGRTVECEVRRDCCLVRSTGILDMAGARIDNAKTQGASQTSQIKAAVGLKKKVVKKGVHGVRKTMKKPQKELQL